MYIAMAYYRGESLRERIKRGPLGVEEAVGFAVQLASGLEKAHARGIIHRDIKPANILLTEDGLVKIVDFGLARLARGTRVTKTGTTMGTVAYMSPEQAQGQDLDQRTDLWSAGVVLYEMLTGRLPFKGEREVSVLYSIVHEEPQRLKSLKPEVPPEVDRIVGRALEKKPQARYSSAGEMLKDLEGYQESLRIPQARPLNLRLLLRQARRPRVAIPVLIFLLALCVFGRWFLSRQAKIRWAREQALPEIERIIEENDVWRNLVAAYTLAEKAEAYIPRDPKLAELFSKCSLRISIKTKPPGVKIYMKEYRTPESDWKYLGVSPLEKIRVPIGIFRWKMEKEGYETVLAASSTWDVSPGARGLAPYDLVRVLDKEGSIPPGMVRVPGTQTERGDLPDFYMDKFEVTNRRYREFINSGGYRNRKYWKQKFTKEGRELSWEKGVKEFTDQSGQPGPATWQAGDYPEGQGDYPVSGISWYEAGAYAEFVGKSLPTRDHWGVALGTYTPLIEWPQLGGFAVFAPFSNFKHKGPLAVGSLQGITAFGAFDMAGNVREWCWNETPKGRLLRGGAWDDNSYMFDNLSQAPPMDRSYKNGFRCALYPDFKKIPEAAFQLATPAEAKDFHKERPVADPVFQVYKDQFSYDKTDLKARVESRQENKEGWILEKVTLDAAYGNERVIAYLFLPTNAAPPYQTVVYFPGSESINQKSSQDLESYYEFTIFLSFIVKNGRAVLYPVYKGTFERGNDTLAALEFGDGKSHQYTELFVQQVKDLRRCVDYLETRHDIDAKKLAYYGMSWGSDLGAIIPAVEDRIKASVLVAAGLGDFGRPEVAQINYVTRVKVPTLILDGKYDTLSPYETSQKPMFDLLGTPPEHKQLKSYETDHIPPRNEFVKETLAWLDRYLGAVK
jgi:dienelactone hydrolase